MWNQIKLSYITFTIVFFVLPLSVFANFEITEIMYDLEGTDTNREWVEVKNTASEPADLSKWFFFSDNSKHALTPQGVSSVPAGGFAVITQNATNFQADWPNYSGLIFDSSWTGFNNETGETISMKDPALNEVSIVTFSSSMGGAGDGNSLQKIGGSWSGASPTPGTENKSSSSNSGADNTVIIASSGSNTSTLSVTSKPKETEVPKMTTNIISKNTVFAGIPFKIDSNTIGYKKEILKVGTLVWNFGDGMSRNTSEHLPFEYSYQYPGEYVLTLSYFYPNNKVPDATDRMIIKVVEPGVVISSIGKNGDPYIEIENQSNVEVDLSGWVIRGANSYFYIPPGTIILPSKSVRFSSRVTGFSGSDVTYVNILSTSGEVVASYPTAKIATYTNNSSATYRSKASVEPIQSSSVINLDDLGASAIKSGSNISTSKYAVFGLVAVIAIGLLSVYFARKKDTVDDVEKQIRAQDMTIIE